MSERASEVTPQVVRLLRGKQKSRVQHRADSAEISDSILSPRTRAANELQQQQRSSSSEVLSPRSASDDAIRKSGANEQTSGEQSAASRLAASGPLPVATNKTAPTQRPAKTWLSKVTARRAMSTGPTPAHDPVTGEFMSLLSSSGEGIDKEDTDATKKKKKKPLPDTVARALPHVLPPVETRLSAAELFSGPQDSINVERLRAHLRREGRLEEEAAMELVKRATYALSKEKNLLELKTPLNVVGDIHGQYYDLTALLDRLDDSPILFLGDFVDRGYFGCEVTWLLLALKLTRPQHVFMIRGNHESRQVTKMYNFFKECKWKYSVQLYEAVMTCFEALPLAALVTNGAGERFFCVHGGISPYMSSCEDVLEIDRFGEVPSDGAMCDLLWSDPLYQKDQPREDWLEMRWDQNRQRKISYTFGWGVLEGFLENNNLMSVIRAHEVKQEGYEAMWFGQESRKYAPLYTVFSAPNYCDMYQNKSGFLVMGAQEGLRFEVMSWEEHPYYLQNFQNGLAFSLPFLMDHMSRLIVGLLRVVKNAAPADEASQQRLDQQIRKLEKWNKLSHQVRTDREALFQELRYLSESSSSEELFKRAFEVDATVEMMSPLSIQKDQDAIKQKRRYSSYF